MSEEDAFLLTAAFAGERETRSTARYRWLCRDRGPCPFVLLQYTHEGRGCFEAGGRVYDVPAEHALLSIVPEDAIYYYPPESVEPWIFSWVNFYGALSIELWTRLRERFGPVLRLPAASGATLEFNRIVSRGAARSYAERFEDSVGIYRFYMACWRELSQPVAEREGAIREAAQFCREHFREPITVKEMAAQSNLSREHFTRMFTASEGESPAAFLLKCRIEAAAEFLKATRLPLAEVALRSGFYSARHLMKAFRRVKGQTPQDFRSSTL